MTDDYDKTP